MSKGLDDILSDSKMTQTYRVTYISGKEEIIECDFMSANGSDNMYSFCIKWKGPFLVLNGRNIDRLEFLGEKEKENE